MTKLGTDELLSAAIADIAKRANISYSAAEKHVEDKAAAARMLTQQMLRQQEFTRNGLEALLNR